MHGNFHLRDSTLWQYAFLFSFAWKFRPFLYCAVCFEGGLVYRLTMLHTKKARSHATAWWTLVWS